MAWSVEKPPCQAACPLDIDVEGYIREIARGKPENALAVIREKCPFPSICGRVCHHPCESACKRGKVDEPLAIEALKRFAADFDWGGAANPVLPSRTESVGIIGSGPAGLTAAYDLVSEGYQVTVYEASEEIGGMLATGIPEFKLPLGIIRKEAEAIKAHGVVVIANTRIGKDVSFSELKQKHDAILIATGAHASVRLPVPGADLDNVIYALPFLKRIKLAKPYPLQGRVAVIGGGNSALDAARSALRMGADEVHLISTRKRSAMPAFDWWVRLAEAEGVVIHNSLIPEKFSSENGRLVSRILLRRVIHSERDPQGTVTRLLDDGPKATVSMPVDHVIVAIGQRPDVSFLSPMNIGLNHRGCIRTDPGTLATTTRGIFAAGDVADCPGTATDSMASGRQAAVAISRYLQGKENHTASLSESSKGVHTGSEILPEARALSPVRREKIETLSIAERIDNFEEIELTFDAARATREANRCLRCKTCLRCFEGTRCVAISLTGNRSKESPVVDGGICVGCGRCARQCLYHNIHVVELR